MQNRSRLEASLLRQQLCYAGSATYVKYDSKYKSKNWQSHKVWGLFWPGFWITSLLCQDDLPFSNGTMSQSASAEAQRGRFASGAAQDARRFGCQWLAEPTDVAENMWFLRAPAIVVFCLIYVCILIKTYKQMIFVCIIYRIAICIHIITYVHMYVTFSDIIVLRLYFKSLKSARRWCCISPHPFAAIRGLVGRNLSSA